MPMADDRQRELVQKTILGSLNRAKETIARVEAEGVVSWAGRPIRVKVHGKKREHGRHSYDFGLEAAVPFRHRHQLPVCCVQSWHARRNARMFGY
jgi:hypothetical protein